MNSRAVIGVIFLAAGAVVWLGTPGHVTWGNHHYLRHVVSAVLVALGLLFVFVGARRS